MKEYDLIAIGTGSAMQVVNGMISENPAVKIAVIDKDDRTARPDRRVGAQGGFAAGADVER